MFNIKKYFYSLLISILFLLLSLLFITLFSYFNLLNIKLINIFMYIIPFLSFFIGGIYIGKNSNNKILYEGLKLGLIASCLLTLILIFKGFKLHNIILYLIIIVSSILGSIIGFKKNS